MHGTTIRSARISQGPIRAAVKGNGQEARSRPLSSSGDGSAALQRERCRRACAKPRCRRYSSEGEALRRAFPAERLQGRARAACGRRLAPAEVAAPGSAEADRQARQRREDPVDQVRRVRVDSPAVRR
jgi:hypothetical protein